MNPLIALRHPWSVVRLCLVDIKHFNNGGKAVKIQRLNMRGVSHEIVLIGFLVIFAVIGTAYIVATHAATPQMAIDLSSPQCGWSINTNALHAENITYGMIGINTTNGIWSNNSCVHTEASYFAHYYLYIVPNYPSATCSRLGYNTPYACGVAAAHYSYTYALSQHLDAYNWWIDTESGAGWASNTANNRSMLSGIYDGLHQKGAGFIGFYSTQGMWNSITGNWGNHHAFWLSEGSNQGLSVGQAAQLGTRIVGAWCGKATGGPNYWVQVEGGVSGLSPNGRIDLSFSCR